MDYLDQSGQAEAIPDLPVDDVAAMTRVSRELTPQQTDEESGTLVLRSRIAELRAGREQAERMRRSKASSLDSRPRRAGPGPGRSGCGHSGCRDGIRLTVTFHLD